jgi:hypothetical protein
MKVKIFSAMLISISLLVGTTRSIIINDNNDDSIRQTKDRNLEHIIKEESAQSEGSSVETQSINSFTNFGKETVDSDYNNEPRFRIKDSLDDTEEKIGELKEMSKLEGSSILKKVPSALHHRVVFPYAFPHVGMIHTHHHHGETEGVSPVEK